MLQNWIPKAVLKRLPIYLSYLRNLDNQENEYISATILADALEMGEVQVRKDLATVSSNGRPKVGYLVQDLIEDLELYLGCKENNKVVIVGVGHLGRALLAYDGFRDSGFEIIAGFDTHKEIINQEIFGKKVLPMTDFSTLCKDENVKIGILTVPEESAQQVCDLMVKSNIKAIWNFAPIRLQVPQDIIVQNENLSSSLIMLSKYLNDKLKLEK